MGAKIHIRADPDLQGYLPQYLENRKLDLGKLKTAFQENDFKTIQEISHKVRGHALSYGFAPLSKICTEIERAAMAKSADPIGSLITEYEQYISNVELE